MYVMELKDLLTELRVYLGETLVREKLSPSAEEQRQRLLARLSQTIHPSQNSGPYLDMSRASTLPTGHSHSVNDINCYEAMSEPSATGVTKSGKLGRRERFLWLGQTRKCWGVLISQSLSLYSSQTDVRPHTVICLDGYQARAAASKNGPIIELFRPGSKTYQFTVQDKDELESWIEAVNEYCGKRSLPPPPPPLPNSPPPAQELYDTPDARVRPVTPNSKQEYEAMQDSFYHVIPDHKVPQEVLYKNIGEGGYPITESSYYNLLPRASEEIYQTISEADKVNRGGETRIQQIIKAINNNQLYEPVECTQELSR